MAIKDKILLALHYAKAGFVPPMQKVFIFSPNWLLTSLKQCCLNNNARQVNFGFFI